ncbi:MAG: zinc-ribbon domain-containing protein, partial [Eubacteriales bacterium]
MFCNKCGNQLEDNSKFCAKCGASRNVVQTPVSSVASQQSPYQNTPIQQKGIITDIWQDPRKKKIAILLIVGIVIAMSFRDRFFFTNKEGEVTNQGVGLEALLTKVISYEEDGSISWWYEYEYDSNGNEVKYIYYEEDGSISMWNEGEYDSNGNCVKYTSYREDGSISRWSEREYDSNGNCVKSIDYREDGSINYCYEYD